MSVGLGVAAGCIARLNSRPASTIIASPQASVSTESSGFAEKRQARQLSGEETMMVKLMHDQISNILTTDYNEGARVLFGGDYSKMRTARNLATDERHYRDLESEVRRLRKKFDEEESIEGKLTIYHKIQLTRARNLELLKIVYERADELRRLRAENEAGFKNNAMTPAKDKNPQAQPVPPELFQ